MLSKLYSWLKRLSKRQEKKPEYTPWGDEIKSKPKGPNPHSFKFWLSNTATGIFGKLSGLFKPPEAKIHVKWLRKVNRGIAAFLCIMYFIIFLFSLPNPFSLFFFFTFYVCLGYLWKTRRIEWVKKE